MTAPEKLAAWLDNNGIRRDWFAEKRMRVNKSTLTRWLSGAQMPAMTARLQIQDATDGAVPVEAWDNPNA